MRGRQWEVGGGGYVVDDFICMESEVCCGWLQCMLLLLIMAARCNLCLVCRRCGVGEQCWVCWCVRVCVMLWALPRAHKNGQLE